MCRRRWVGAAIRLLRMRDRKRVAAVWLLSALLGALPVMGVMVKVARPLLLLELLLHLLQGLHVCAPHECQELALLHARHRQLSHKFLDAPGEHLVQFRVPHFLLHGLATRRCPSGVPAVWEDVHQSTQVTAQQNVRLGVRLTPSSTPRPPPPNTHHTESAIGMHTRHTAPPTQTKQQRKEKEEKKKRAGTRVLLAHTHATPLSGHATTHFVVSHARSCSASIRPAGASESNSRKCHRRSA